jgi:hypothetical protein
VNRILAVCPICDQLVRVIPGTYKGEGRQQWWWPLPHDADGKPCEGSKRAI